MGYTDHDGPAEAAGPNTQNRLPRFLNFLTKVADAVARRAEEEDAGTVTWEIVQLMDRTQDRNGLSCVRLTHTAENGEQAHFRLFAAGFYRNKNLIKIEREDESIGNRDPDAPPLAEGEHDYVLVSSNPLLVLSYISF